MIVLEAIYLMLPAYFANMAPVFFRAADILDAPVDFGKKLGKHRMLGDNKTWRGLVASLLIGLLAYLIQTILPWQVIPWVAAVFLVVGAILGDLAKSLFKRQLGIRPGKPWIPLDQIDFALGSMLVLCVYPLRWQLIVTILIISPILHIMANHVAYYTHIRKERW